MKVDVLFQGFPGRMTRGYMSWSSIVYVESGEYKILFDTGGMGERNELPKRIKEHGINIDDINLLVLSHFHHDHVMNFEYFRNCRIVLHKKEAEWVQSDPDDWPMPKYLFPVLQSTGRLELINKDEEIAPGIKTLLSPGHTPGCMSLVICDKDRPVIVLAGDAVKNMTELATGEVAMSHDNQESAKTIRKIRNIADIVIPGHDRTLKVEPDKIIAVTACHEIITVPSGVADVNNPKTFELVIEQNSLKISKEGGEN
jgi:glyoxylase-like metal-dependent hydrolase (beta-lactamase superfamily II)